MKDRRKYIAGKHITTLTTGGKPPSYHVPAPETLADKMQRDLDAWLEAKAAIARARQR